MQGTAAESTVGKVEIKVVNGGASTNYSFTYVAGTDNGASAGDFTYDPTTKIYTLKSTKLITVNPGTADVYVTINGKQTIDNDLNTTNGTVAAAYATTPTLDDITANNGVAVANNFLMSGKTLAATINENQVNTVLVPVDRVAAKVEENSPITLSTYKFSTTHKTGTDTYTADENTTVQLAGYSFINVNPTSYVYAQTAMYVPAAFQWASAKVSDATNDVLWSSLNSKAVSVNGSDVKTNGTTYMLENESATYPTYVVYKAQLYRNGTAVTTDCFTYEKTVNFTSTVNNVTTTIPVKKVVFYDSFADLNADNNNMFSGAYQLSATSSYDAFAAAGVEKYTAGVCYYSAKIETGTAFKVVRNNWYKLAVSAISNLGFGEIDNDNLQKTTLLDVQIQVKPWTVWNQNVVF